MTEELKVKLAKLRALAPELNKATDEATAVVQAVDRMLGQELSLGISAEAWFDAWPAEGYERDEGDQEHRLDEVPTVHAVLAYGRVDGKFCIHVVEETRREGPDDRNVLTTFTIAVQRTPWSSCPRDLKLKSFAALPELLGEIVDQVEKLTVDAANTSKAARELLDAIEPKTAIERARDLVVKRTPPPAPVVVNAAPSPLGGQQRRRSIKNV